MSNLPKQFKKGILLLKIVLTFHYLNKLFKWSQKFCKFSAFSLEFQNFSWSLEFFFLTVGQNNFGNKIPYLNLSMKYFLYFRHFTLCWYVSKPSRRSRWTSRYKGNHRWSCKQMDHGSKCIKFHKNLILFFERIKKIRRWIFVKW